MPFKYCLTVYMLLVSAGLVKGQQLLFENVSNRLKLPTHESYNVMQDSKGYLWISTEQGLCRYNGYEIKVFNKNSGLPENSCYAVREDAKGNLWMLTSTNRILRFKDDSLVEAPFSKAFSEKLRSGLLQGYLLSFDKTELVINTQRSTYGIDTVSNQITLLMSDTNYGRFFVEKGGALIERRRFANLVVLYGDLEKHSSLIKIGISTSKGIKPINVPYKGDGHPSWRVLTAHNKKGESFISMGRILIKLGADFKYTTYELSNEIVSIYSDADDGLWIGTIKDGVYYYSDTRDMESNLISLAGLSVTGICVDKENGVWCTTLEKGLFYCHSKYVESFADEPGLDLLADLLKYEQGRIFVSTEESKLVELEKHKIATHKLAFLGNNSVTDIFKEHSGWIIAGKNIVVRTNDKFLNPQYVKISHSKFWLGANQLVSTDNGRLFEIHHGQIDEIIGTTSVHRREPLESAGKCLAYIGNNYLLYGTKDGVYKMPLAERSATRQYKSSRIKDISGLVTKIMCASRGEIWITTRENGLYILRRDTAVNIAMILKIPAERFYDVTEDSRGIIWVGSENGLVRIEGSNKSHPFSIYNTQNGLLGNEIFKVAADSGFIYFSTASGIGRFSLTSDLSNITRPAVYINNIKVNNLAMRDKDLLSLHHDQNSIKVKVDALAFKETGGTSLFYILKNKQGLVLRENKMRGNLIILDNLPPDSYRLNVYAVNSDGLKSSEPATLIFEIHKPFWRSWWFIGLCILAIGFILFGLAKLFIYSIRKKEEEKTRFNKQLAELQLSALQAQMNPHFIFNAINSIQTYILENELQMAYDYLSKFSKLVRMVLHNAKEKSLTLEKELEVLCYYIELEQMRFEDKFDFTLRMDEAVEAYAIKLPPMLLQPYVENAIWHGLMPLKKTRRGKLTIEIDAIDDMIRFAITDNGIGRKLSAGIKKTPGHKSVGMTLTEERMNLLGSLTGSDRAKVYIHDLYYEGDPCGTKVEFYLPNQ